MKNFAFSFGVMVICGMILNHIGVTSEGALCTCALANVIGYVEGMID
jgi:hypothetical protein